MKVWVLIGVCWDEGVPQDNICGVFATRELAAKYRIDKTLDDCDYYAYIEYAEYTLIEDVV